MRDKLHPLGFQSTATQGAHQITQALRTVTQGKPSSIFQQPRRLSA